MKHTKLLVVSLISLLGLMGCNKNNNTPKEETVHVEKVELGKTAVRLQVNGTVQLTATITPTNATTKDVTFSSSNESVATVSATGLVTAVGVGTAVITVTTTDGSKTATCTIEVLEHFENLEIDSLAAPAFVSAYKTNTAVLDDVETIQANPNPARNQYYKNEEGKADLYKVGNVNPFKFETTAVAFDERERESHINNPDTVLELSVMGEEGYEKVTNLSTYVTVNASHNEFQFNQDAAGNQFKLKLAVNETAYSSISASCKPVEFEFEVFDGYNVYSKEELALFDNRSIHPTSLGDPWAEIKEANATLKQFKTTNIKGIALHDNMTITNEDVPSSIKWTKAEVDAYDSKFSDSIGQWVDRINASDDDVEVAKADLYDSLKDFSTLYYRVTDNDEFRFEGNYFTIDVSRVKQVMFFSDAMEEGTLHFYGGDSLMSIPDGSHAQIFGFNCQEEGFDGAENVARGGSNSLSNVTLIGNGKNVASELYLGGLIMYKVDATTLNCQNIISSDTFITFLTRVNSDYLGKNQPLPASDSEEDIAAFEELQPGETVINIDRYKCFDSYNSMFYIWGTRKNTITNSFMKGAGGPLFILDEINADEYGKDAKATSDADKNMHGFVPHVDAQNVYFENWITGSEPWFKTKQADSYAAKLKLIGSLNGPIGGSGATLLQNAEAFPAVIQALLPYLTTTTKMYDGDDEDLQGVDMFNLIAIGITGANFLGNNSDGQGGPLNSTFTINNTVGEYVNEYEFNMAKLLTAPYAALRAMYMMGNDGGMIFESQNGAISCVGTDDAIFYNPADGKFYPLQNTDAYKAQASQINYLHNQGQFPYEFVTDTTIGDPTLDGGIATLLAMDTGNYATFYVKAPVIDILGVTQTAEFFGALVGTTPLLTSGILPQQA